MLLPLRLNPAHVNVGVLLPMSALTQGSTFVFPAQMPDTADEVVTAVLLRRDPEKTKPFMPPLQMLRSGGVAEIVTLDPEHTVTFEVSELPLQGSNSVRGVLGVLQSGNDQLYSEITSVNEPVLTYSNVLARVLRTGFAVRVVDKVIGKSDHEIEEVQGSLIRIIEELYSIFHEECDDKNFPVFTPYEDEEEYFMRIRDLRRSHKESLENIYTNCEYILTRCEDILRERAPCYHEKYEKYVLRFDPAAGIADLPYNDILALMHQLSCRLSLSVGKERYQPNERWSLLSLMGKVKASFTGHCEKAVWLVPFDDGVWHVFGNRGRVEDFIELQWHKMRESCKHTTNSFMKKRDRLEKLRRRLDEVDREEEEIKARIRAAEQQGRVEGIECQKIGTARRALSRGLDVELAAELSELSVADVRELEAEMRELE